MKKRIIILFILICTSVLKTPAQTKKFILSDHCIQAFNAIFSLRMEEGKKLLIQEISNNPNNAMPILLQNYMDFIVLSFNDNPTLYNVQKNLKNKRLDYIDDADNTSPFYLYGKALIHFQWSVISAKNKDYLSAAFDFRKANILFKDNEKKFPGFIYNKTYLGAQQSIIGSIPEGYRWISNIMGLKGNLKQGMLNIQQAASSKDNVFRNESIFLYAYLKAFMENKSDEALKYAENLHLDVKSNHLFTFMMSNFYLTNYQSYKTEPLINSRKQNNDYLKLVIFDYEIGCAKLYKLDPTCIVHLNTYIKNTESQYYKRDACYKIAIMYYLSDNIAKATEYLNKIKNVGSNETDADKLATDFAKKNTWPNKELMKARLQTDGGYFKQALKIMNDIKSENLVSINDKIEFAYRYARIYDEMGLTEKAIAFYTQVIEIGKNETSYFAARSALEIGFIYEKMKNKNMALQYFNMVFHFKNKEFKNSLDQKAKSGIARLNGG